MGTNEFRTEVGRYVVDATGLAAFYETLFVLRLEHLFRGGLSWLSSVTQSFEYELLP